MGHGITCQCSRNKSSRTRRVARFHVATRMSKTPRERSAIDDETFVQRSLSNFARCLALWMVTQDAPEPLNPGAARGEPDRVAASNAPCLRPAKEQPQSARDGLRVPSTGCAVPCVFLSGARKPRQRQSRPLEQTVFSPIMPREQEET